MNIHEVETLLKAAAGLKQLHRIFENYLVKYGITHFAFTYYSRHANSQNKIITSYSSKPYEIWHQYYLAEHYEDVDTTMTTVYRSTIPVLWDLNQQLKEAKTPREKQMRLDSIKFGAEKGICIPIHGPFEDFATLVLVQMKKQTFLNEWHRVQQEILWVSHCYYQGVKRLLLKESEKNDYLLTAHQIRCLTLTSKHYSPSDIAIELGITERTVNFHLQNANKRLGTKNKHQSVAKAIEKGLLYL